jgi:exodeoxyribonuclease VII small subunit
VTDPQQAAIPTDDAINAMSFEQALAQLTQLVEKLESGQLSLEDSVAAFETGVKLSRRCEALLDSAEQRLQILNDAAAE